MAPRLQRRAFLQAALSCVALLSPVGSVGCAREAAKTETPPRFRTTGTREDLIPTDFFDDASIDDALFIGQRYLASLDTADTNIKQQIQSTVDLIETSESDDGAIADLRARILADFGEKATALVDGWVFSVTELNLCLLIGTLVNPDTPDA